MAEAIYQHMQSQSNGHPSTPLCPKQNTPGHSSSRPMSSSFGRKIVEINSLKNGEAA